MLPTFFIVGAQKAATTTLWSALRQHPDIFLPDLKEPNFFLGGHWARNGRAWYESLYAAAGNAQHRGDASTGYSMFPFFDGAPERAAALVPDARIIYTIRHPVQRMISQWVHATTNGREHRSLADALTWGSLYHLTSCYGLQLARWAAVFPRRSLLVLRSEDLARDPAGTIDRVLTHLELPPGWRPMDAAIRANSSQEKLRASSELRIVAGAFRGAGFETAAVRLTKRSKFKERTRLVRPFAEEEVRLPAERADALLECFRSDLAMLRSFIGSNTDLYGKA